MNLWKKLTRLNISLVGVMTTISLISSSAYATLDNNDLFLLAIDPSRNGSQASYALDLNFSILNLDIATFGSVTDAGLGNWLGEASDLGTVKWGVFGAGNDGLLSEFRIVSTVNPADTPTTLKQENIDDAIERAQGYIVEFNAVAQGGDNFSVVGATVDGFPNELAENWGGVTGFSTMGHIGDALAMYIFEIQQINPFEGLPPSLQAGGDWTLSAQGQVSFGAAAVPVPAALWMFASALFGLFGIRRRRQL